MNLLMSKFMSRYWLVESIADYPPQTPPAGGVWRRASGLRENRKQILEIMKLDIGEIMKNEKFKEKG